MQNIWSKNKLDNTEILVDKLTKLYSSALLHISWIIVHKSGENEKSKRYLLFSMVELYPKEMSPIPIEEQSTEIKGERLYYQRIKIAVTDIINVYLGAIENGIIPIFWNEDGKNDQGILEGMKSAEKEIICGDLLSIKPWPHFELSPKVSDAHGFDNPFIAEIWNTVKTHQLMPEKVNTAVVCFSESEEVNDWLSQYIGWNISGYPELVGSVILVMPNPYYSGCDIRVIPGDLSENIENVKFDFYPRAYIDIPKLSVLPLEKTHFGLFCGKPTDVIENSCKLEMSGKIDRFGYYIIDEEGNLIDYNGFNGFWRRSVLDFRTEGAKKIIKRPDNGEEESVSLFDSMGIIINGEISEKTIEKRLAEAESRRAVQKRINKAQVNFFFNNHGEAECYLRKLIENARESIFIVDPYWATNELFIYAMRITRRNVKVEVLTSSLALKEYSKLEVYKEKGLEAPLLGKELFLQIKEYKNKTGADLSVFVMTGNRPAIHDRFLIVDGNAWFCGGSFNEIGNRMSCIVKLPDSKELMEIISNIMQSDRVVTLEKWLESEDNSDYEE